MRTCQRSTAMRPVVVIAMARLQCLSKVFIKSAGKVTVFFNGKVTM